jgi:hypothetical protein
VIGRTNALDAPRGGSLRMKNRVAAMSVVAGLVAGGVAGAALGITGFAGAASSPSTTVAPATPAPSGTTPQSNEDPTHEQGESAQREADENAGRVGHHGRNEDPAHESSESPQREAEEDAGNGGAAATTPAQ